MCKHIIGHMNEKSPLAGEHREGLRPSADDSTTWKGIHITTISIELFMLESTEIPNDIMRRLPSHIYTSTVTSCMSQPLLYTYLLQQPQAAVARQREMRTVCLMTSRWSLSTCEHCEVCWLLPDNCHQCTHTHTHTRQAHSASYPRWDRKRRLVKVQRCSTAKE